MKRILIALLAVCALGIASAGSSTDRSPVDPSPESMVNCWRSGVSSISTPEGFVLGGCPLFNENTCATCIISLEGQGCKVTDVVVREPFSADDAQLLASVTYFFSCVAP